MQDTPPTYQAGNRYQRAMYQHLSNYNRGRGVMRFGCSDRGNEYPHLLDPRDGRLNFFSDAIHEAVLSRFGSHKAGDLERVLFNTAASQAMCFNLFAPLAADLRLASQLFSQLLDTTLAVCHIEIEFTPNTARELDGFSLPADADESLGDQGARAGTDADVGVFYREPDGEKGVLLIETKFIEAEFSVCGSYKSKTKGPQLRSICSGPDFYRTLVAERKRDTSGRPLCGYLKYENWPATEASTLVDSAAVANAACCPFRGSGQQLWRNLLLAERVASSRSLRRADFMVLAPSENAGLWREGSSGDVDANFRRVLTQRGRERFHRVQLEQVWSLLRDAAAQAETRAWLAAFREKYLPSAARGC